MSYQEKDLCWLCSLLASTNARIPLIESVFVVKEEVVQWVYSTKSGKVKKRNLTELPDKSAVSVLNYFASLHKSESSSSELVCTLATKGNRVPVDWDKIEEPAVLHALLARCSVIQDSFEDMYSPSIYEVMLDLQEGKYHCSFLVKRGAGTEQVASPRLWYKVLSLVKVVLRLVERVKRRQVTQMKLELLLSLAGDVYLYGCPGLTLAAGKLQGKEAGRKQGGNYRFGTPVGVREGGNEETKTAVREELERSMSPGFLPKLHKGASSFAGFDNPNFRELLALNYAKNKPDFQYQSYDTVFRTLDSEFLGDLEEECKRARLSPSKAERDLRFPAATRRASKLTTEITLPSALPKEMQLSPMEVIPHIASSPTVSSHLSPKHRLTPSLLPVSKKLFAKGQLDPLFAHKKSLTHRRGESLRTVKYYFTTLKQ